MECKTISISKTLLISLLALLFLYPSLSFSEDLLDLLSGTISEGLSEKEKTERGKILQKVKEDGNLGDFSESTGLSIGSNTEYIFMNSTCNKGSLKSKSVFSTFCETVKQSETCQKVREEMIKEEMIKEDGVLKQKLEELETQKDNLSRWTSHFKSDEEEEIKENKKKITAEMEKLVTESYVARGEDYKKAAEQYMVQCNDHSGKSSSINNRDDLEACELEITTSIWSLGHEMWVMATSDEIPADLGNAWNFFLLAYDEALRKVRTSSGEIFFTHKFEAFRKVAGDLRGKARDSFSKLKNIVKQEAVELGCLNPSGKSKFVCSAMRNLKSMPTDAAGLVEVEFKMKKVLAKVKAVKLINKNLGTKMTATQLAAVKRVMNNKVNKKIPDRNKDDIEEARILIEAGFSPDKIGMVLVHINNTRQGSAAGTTAEELSPEVLKRVNLGPSLAFIIGRALGDVVDVAMDVAEDVYESVANAVSTDEKTERYDGKLKGLLPSSARLVAEKPIKTIVKTPKIRKAYNADEEYAKILKREAEEATAEKDRLKGAKSTSYNSEESQFYYKRDTKEERDKTLRDALEGSEGLEELATGSEEKHKNPPLQDVQAERKHRAPLQDVQEEMKHRAPLQDDEIRIVRQRPSNSEEIQTKESVHKEKEQNPKNKNYTSRKKLRFPGVRSPRDRTSETGLVGAATPQDSTARKSASVPANDGGSGSLLAAIPEDSIADQLALGSGLTNDGGSLAARILGTGVVGAATPKDSTARKSASGSRLVKEGLGFANGNGSGPANGPIGRGLSSVGQAKQQLGNVTNQLVNKTAGSGDYTTSSNGEKQSVIDGTFLRPEDWEIYISPKPGSAGAVLQALAPVLYKNKVQHKFISSEGFDKYVQKIKRKSKDQGEFITLHPSDGKEALRQVQLVVDILRRNNFQDTDFVDNPYHIKLAPGVYVTHKRAPEAGTVMHNNKKNWAYKLKESNVPGYIIRDLNNLLNKVNSHLKR